MSSSVRLQCLAVVLFILSTFNEVSSSSSCAFQKYTAKRDWTTILTPGWPDPFPQQTQCVWQVWAGKNERIKVEFSTLNLDNAKNKVCKYQWLSVRDGSDKPNTAAPKYTLCGKKKPSSIFISRGNTITLRLVSDTSLPENKDIYMGFDLRFAVETIKSSSVPSEFRSFRPSPDAATKPKPVTVNRSLGSMINKLKPAGRPRQNMPTVDAGQQTNEADRLAEQNRLAEERNRQIEEDNMRRNLGGKEDENAFEVVPAAPVDAYPDVFGTDEEPTDVSIINPKNKVTMSLASTGDQKHTDGWIRPPPKSKKNPLPHHMQVLIGIIGGLLGFVFIVIVLKKCWWDKRGDNSNAYNSVRKFKDKNAQMLSGANRPNNIMQPTVEVEGKKPQSQSGDSGVSVDKTNTNLSQKNGHDNPALAIREKRQPIEKPLAYIEDNEVEKSKRRSGDRKMPRNHTFDGVPVESEKNPDVDKWVANTFDERIKRRDDPPDYNEAMTPEEIENEKRRQERRRRQRMREEEEARGGSGQRRRNERRHRERDERRGGGERRGDERRGEERRGGEERRHRRQHRRR